MIKTASKFIETYWTRRGERLIHRQFELAGDRRTVFFDAWHPVSSHGTLVEVVDRASLRELLLDADVLYLDDDHGNTWSHIFITCTVDR